MSLKVIQAKLDAPFLDEYTIEAVIGQGLDGEIIRFSKKQDQTKGVLKIPRHSLSHEIEILSKIIPHPNIVAFNGVQHTKKGDGILLEHLEGQDLFSMLEEENNFYESKAKDILRQILTAVEALHSQNIVHHDIKLENIHVSPKGSVKLLDFGLSETVSDDVSLTELSGTPSYIAPEMINKTLNPSGNGYGRPVDVWACGVLLYAMLSGSFPFWHEKQLRRYQLILEGEIDFSNDGWEEISEQAKCLIRSLLTIDPNQRLRASEALKHPWFKIFT